jgi:hypothetical protein
LAFRARAYKKLLREITKAADENARSLYLILFYQPANNGILKA